VPQEALDKFAAWEKLRFDVMFVGDDWFRNERWKALEERFAGVGVKIVYFPYTKGTSSTLVNEVLQKVRAAELDELLPGPLTLAAAEAARRVA
jgi:glycerol-3-phosphate cytidylyltransferase